MKLSPSTLFYAELALFVIPILYARRHRGRPDRVSGRAVASNLEAKLHLLPGDEGLAEKILDQWGDLAEDAHDTYPDVSTALILALIQVESRGNRKFVDEASGAQGLMQLTRTAQQEFSVSDPYDAWESIEAGTHRASDLLVRYQGDLFYAVAAVLLGRKTIDPLAQRHNKTLPKEGRARLERVFQLATLYRRLL